MTTSVNQARPGLGASYTIWPGNRVGLFYTPTHTGIVVREQDTLNVLYKGEWVSSFLMAHQHKIVHLVP